MYKLAYLHQTSLNVVIEYLKLHVPENKGYSYIFPFHKWTSDAEESKLIILKQNLQPTEVVSDAEPADLSLNM